MCGIVGFTGQSDPAALRKALDLMAHRGPDGNDVYQDDYLSLGHCRLVILDRETGQQPMFSADRNYVIIFNGEIYNYLDLKQNLKKRGVVFRTRSDTEVLLYWLMHHGIEGLSSLNGMFAFAFWDRKRKSLLLGRDRLGIKPLYYTMREGNIVFASEIKAMIPRSGSLLADYETLLQFFTFQNVLTDSTFFKNVNKLLPGSWLKWHSDKPTSKGIYWKINFNRKFEGNLNDAAEVYSDALQHAVVRNMIADVPVGANLSGGIDSSSVATVASKHSLAPFHTFTGAFTDAPYYDERIGSRAVSSKIGAILHEVEITSQDYIENIERVIYHLDEPTLGTGALPQFIVSRLASKNVRVVLTGHGGDELFAGYQVNKAMLLRKRLKANPLSFFTLPFSVRPNEWSRVLYYLLFPLIQPEVRHGLFIMVPKKKRSSFLTADFLASHANYNPLEHIEDILRQSGATSADESLLVLYLKTYLPTLFIQEDKVGMAHSIEARMPLCDNEIIDLAIGISLETKLAGNTLKAIPRMAMKNNLPPILFKLPKRGFPTPFAQWYRKKPLREFMESTLFDRQTVERGIFNITGLRKCFERHMASTSDNLMDYARANLLYSFSMVELWFRRFIDKHPIESTL